MYSRPATSDLFGFDAPRAPKFDSSRYVYPPDTLGLEPIYGNMSSVGVQMPQLNEFALLPGKNGGSQEDTIMGGIEPSHGGSDNPSNISPRTFSCNQFSCPPPGPDFTLFPEKRFCPLDTFPRALEREMAETAAALNEQHDTETTQFQEDLSSLSTSLSVDSPSLKSQDSVFSNQPNCRFLTILHTPTAMAGDPHEPPVSYMNRNCVYNLTVSDNSPVQTSKQPVNYRTTIRLRFDQEEERSNPPVYWQLWREARAKNDTSFLNSPYAIEYVGQSSFLEIEQQSFDGFSFTWVGDPLSIPKCDIALRFNFLSTDFTRSKGVKGIPLRLYAKTTQLSMENTPHHIDQPDTYYCRIKLFRDHGAERKLSNDKTNIMKTIEKMKKQVCFQDKPRKPKYNHRKGDLKASSGSAIPWDQEESILVQSTPLEMHEKRVAKLQKAMCSAQPQSVLSLLGDEMDDPDLSIVQTPGDKGDELGKVGMTPGLINGRRYSRFSSTESSDIQADSGYNPADANSITNDFKQAGRAKTQQNDQRVACFYVRRGDKENSTVYYRAIYLRERTVRNLAKNLVRGQSERMLPISRVIFVNKIGLKVAVDDDFVREIPEGQDMIIHMEQASDDLEIQLFF